MSAAEAAWLSAATGAGPSFWEEERIFQSPFVQTSFSVMVDQAVLTGLVEPVPARPTRPVHQTSTVFASAVAPSGSTFVPIGTVWETKMRPEGVVPSVFRPRFLRALPV